MKVGTKHNPLIYNFFKVYTALKIRRNFHSVTIRGDFIDRYKSVLILSNHFSWWDGFWIMYLNMRIFKRKLHFMMLEEQLERFWFFRYSGGYPVRKGTRSIIESINYTIGLLSDRKNLVFLFPQGMIESMHQDVISFEKGVVRISSGINGRAQIIFVVNIIDYFSEQKPSLYICLKEYNDEDGKETNIAEAFNRFYRECISEQVKISG